MATLILDYSSPVMLACLIGIVSTVAMCGLVAGIAALANAMQAKRPCRFATACHACASGHPVSTASL